ncbi:MAG: class I SAM-dependent RNA methyltransferase [Alphaproteobacteria bacterium]|nr:class I SAM-dependent RNA methyltransferase [Alphaproteobacteria bacterium]
MTHLPEPAFAPEELTSPPCPFFEDCGGCLYQHLKPQTYSDFKTNLISELILKNNIKVDEFKKPVFIGPRTRRRAQFILENVAGKILIGFHKYHSHMIVPIDKCLILKPSLEDLLTKLSPSFTHLIPFGQSISIWIQECDNGQLDCVITGLRKNSPKLTSFLAKMAEELHISRISLREQDTSRPEIALQLRPILKTSGELNVALPPLAFLQPSLEGETIISTAILDWLAGLKLGKKDKIADLFSGCGTFAGMIMQKYAVDAYEFDQAMCNSLKLAAKSHPKIEVFNRDLFKEPITRRELRNYRAVILDPPRAGAKEQCQNLAQSDVRDILYVSCAPTTFARDAKILQNAGYRLRSLQLIDQFTWSGHSELIGIFHRHP